MRTKILCPPLFLALVFLLSGVALAQSNFYTYPGPDVELGQIDAGTNSSGQHYIAARGDTVYVLRQFGGRTYCYKSTDGGQSFSPGVRINSTPGAYNASLKVDTAGVVYVAYQSGDADIYFTKSTDGGQLFTSGVKVNDDTIPQIGQEKPVIAVNSKGQVFIAWIDKRFGSNWTIFTSHSLNRGESFSPNVNVNDSLMHREDPDIAADDSGHVYVAYEELIPNVRQVAFARSDDTGRTFGFHTYASDVPADGNSCCAVDPSMAVNESRLIGVSWQEGRNDSVSLRIAVSQDFGQTFSPSVIVDTSGYPQFPSLTSQNGIFYVAWRATHRRTPSGPNLDHIWFSYSPDGGKTFMPFVDAVPDDTNWVPHDFPSIWVNETGKAFVAWADARWDPLFNEIGHLFVSAGTPNWMKGDLNLDGLVTPIDVMLELNATFLGRQFPAPFGSADGNCDGRLSPADVVLLLLYFYVGNPFPC